MNQTRRGLAAAPGGPGPAAGPVPARLPRGGGPPRHAEVRGPARLLTFHQGAWALLHAAGLMPPAPYPTDPVPPLGVPRIANFCFWAGLYGAAFGLALPRLPRAPTWLLGLGLGLLATLVLWFVVAPLRG